MLAPLLCLHSESLAKALAVRSVELANEQHGQLADALDRLVRIADCNAFASACLIGAARPPGQHGCLTWNSLPLSACFANENCCVEWWRTFFWLLPAHKPGLDVQT